MSTIDRTTTLVELATLISEALEEAGITSTLSGGAVVSIYTLNEYESYDLDFITSERNSAIARALAPLGFHHQPGTRAFIHPDTEYFAEFPPGPLGLGETVLDHQDAAVIETGYGRLRILDAGATPSGGPGREATPRPVIGMLAGRSDPALWGMIST